MKSHRGEPLRASASVQTAAGEEITADCLALGDERDAPGTDHPLLRDARLGMSDAGDAIELSTDAPITSPAVSVVLKVQCPGQPYTARHFDIQLPPRDTTVRVAQTARGPGTNLKTAAGESPESIARVMFPRDRNAQRNLARAIIHTNPGLFPDQRSRQLPAGTTLFIPDLRTVRAIVAALPPPAVSSTPAPKPAAKPSATVPPSAVSAPPRPAREPAVRPAHRPREASRLVLRLSSHELDLRFSEGVTDAKREELRRQYRGEPLRAARPPVVAPDTAALELKIAELRDSQSVIDSQLKSLEDAVEGLRKAIVAFTPQPRPAPAPTPRPEPRPAPQPVLAKKETPWLLWAVIAFMAVLVAAGAFRLGRRIQARNLMREHEQRIDSLLDEARAAAGPLFTPGEPEQSPRTVPAPRPRRPAARPAPPVADAAESAADAAARKASNQLLAGADEPGLAVATQPNATSGVDLELDRGPAAQTDEALAVSTNLRQAMDLALDNSRSMFTDVDRFIALGRTQNAISLLEFQVHKDPNDRDSWIKLLAIYRQEAMDREFERAHREFKQRFPGDTTE
ncbi:MAG TPA: hypothetical protein VMP00_10825 [Burkholderiales bacterium]|nr:hypothetical protein [Burkholderiales bacterium]